jgi:hypothetical protein
MFQQQQQQQQHQQQQHAGPSSQQPQQQQQQQPSAANIAPAARAQITSILMTMGERGQQILAAMNRNELTQDQMSQMKQMMLMANQRAANGNRPRPCPTALLSLVCSSLTELSGRRLAALQQPQAAANFNNANRPGAGQQQQQAQGRGMMANGQQGPGGSSANPLGLVPDARLLQMTSELAMKLRNLETSMQQVRRLPAHALRWVGETLTAIVAAGLDPGRRAREGQGRSGRVAQAGQAAG